MESDAVVDNIPMLVGDFNIHVDDCRNKDATTFLNTLEEAGFQQHVMTSTHQAGHTPDLLITRRVDEVVPEMIPSGTSIRS